MDILLAIAIMALGAVVLGAALGFASIKFKVEGDPLVEKIEAILPQTQCGQCSYPGCKPYAEAIAKGEADINKCPPGGAEGVQRLADLLERRLGYTDELDEAIALPTDFSARIARNTQVIAAVTSTKLRVLSWSASSKPTGGRKPRRC